MRDDLQFYHHNYFFQKYSLAVFVPSITLLERILFSKDKYILTEVGITYCSKKDRFSKIVGREESKKRMKKQKCDLIRIEFDKKQTYYTFLVESLDIEFTLKTRNGKPKAHLIAAETLENKTTSGILEIR